MIAFLDTQNISLTDVLLMVGIVGILFDRVATARGWSKPANLLRIENGDLLRQNGELRDTVQRHESKMDEQAERIRRLEAQVAELEKTNQAAVLDAVARHERGEAEGRRELRELLMQIRDNLVLRS